MFICVKLSKKKYKSIESWKPIWNTYTVKHITNIFMKFLR